MDYFKPLDLTCTFLNYPLGTRAREVRIPRTFFIELPYPEMLMPASFHAVNPKNTFFPPQMWEECRPFMSRSDLCLDTITEAVKTFQGSLVRILHTRQFYQS